MKAINLLYLLCVVLLSFTACNDTEGEQEPSTIYVTMSQGEYSVPDGGELRIPLKLNTPFESAVTIAVTIDDKFSDAVEGTDFTIEKTAIIFAPGQTESEIVIKILPHSIMEDMHFVLRAKAEGDFDSNTATKCRVTIENVYYPSFESPTYSFPDGSSSQNIYFNLPHASTKDIVAKITVIPAQGTTEGVEFRVYSKEFKIHKTVTRCDIGIEIKNGVDLLDPSFKIVINSINGIVLKKEIATTVTITKGAFRNMLGVWSFESGTFNGNNIISHDYVEKVIVTTDKYNKTFKCEGRFVRYENWEHYPWYMSFDAKTKEMTILTTYMVTRSYYGNGTDVYLLFYKDNDWSTVQTPIPTTLNADRTTITFDVEQIKGAGHIDAYPKPRPDPGYPGVFFHWDGIKMTKK